MINAGNENKIILDLCGGTGSWSKPYEEAGYKVINITLPDYNVENVEFDTHAMIFEGQKKYDRLTVLYSDVHGILAAPPCTEFSMAKTTAPRDFVKGLEIVNACMKIIQVCRLRGNLKFWAIENPMGFLRQFLGKPPLTFNPCDYGDPYTKKTDLWGYYNLPKQSKVNLSQEMIDRCAINNRPLPSLPEGYRPPDGRLQAARRAITPPSFAQAFYKANK